MSYDAIWEALRGVTVADVVDVAIVAGVIYGLLIWFEQTRAAFVARGIFLFVVVFFVARQTKMYLTTWIFQGVFAIALIALVVIFQEELRRFFERIAAWGLGRAAPGPIAPRTAEILVRTAGQFARERIGALIVLQGRDPLARHLDGGYELEGVLSEALLASLFDSHSEGHDGAVVIEGQRVTRFGTHLPLSSNFQKLSGTGTRHAAALGVSERTDALAMVVSEQKGTMAVARDGEFEVVPDLETLQARLAAFLCEKTVPPPAVRWPGFFRHHMVEKLVAVAFAATLWLLFAQDVKPVTRIFQAMVELHNLPVGLQVEMLRPAKIRVSVAGLKRDFGALDPDRLRVHLDLDGAEIGARHIVVSEDNLPIPRTLRLVSARPGVVEVILVPARPATPPERDRPARVGARSSSGTVWRIP